ncbi:unnamed protein product [Mytilus coruscus]|uniref:THAP-type domain-containing protein n=1 Tax=Mytilus coruscus TaxID=42192 RepID=A0A6J8DRP4_MYTCO|nr:unnamed protein product [Mytilus coruscus]
MGKLYCCATNCHNYSGKSVNGNTVTLHRFPVHRRHKSIWQCRVSRKQWKPTSCSRLCSEHFITKRGPTKDHPLPSIFDHKIFKTTNFDSSFKEFEENNDCTEYEADHDIMCDGNEEANNDIADDPSKHFFTVDNPSTINTSVMLNDYCGYIDPSHISSKLNQETQCENTCTGILNDTSSQTDTEKENKPYTVFPITDAEVNTTLPFLAIEDLSSEEVTFYTGLPNKPTFYLLYEHIMSNRKTVDPETGGRPQKLRGVDEFFMVLMRLRLGLLTQDLARRFNVSVSTCSKIFNKWIDLMYEHLNFLVAWPDRETVKCNMPDSFKRRYPNCRVIVDCTEIFTETPQSLSNKGRMYSDYKSHMTWKVLIGISPNGVITHVSDLWSGSISDKQITKSSGLIDKCEPGDAIMGDKGFLISDMCTPKGIYLIVPPTKKNGKLTKHEVEKTRRIANLRIHVERAMERIKNFRIIQGVMPISMSEKVSKIVFIVCALCNLLPPLIQQ